MRLRRAVWVLAGAILLAANAHAASGAARPAALPFIENDFEKALAAAKASGKPLFVEVWAPW